MGTWGNQPWDNDTAADWFGDLFDDLSIRERVRYTLENSTSVEEMRAASTLLLLLGRTYVWPIDHIDSDLKLCIEVMTSFAENGEGNDATRLAIRLEIEILEGRLREENVVFSDANNTHWLGLR